MGACGSTDISDAQKKANAKQQQREYARRMMEEENLERERELAKRIQIEKMKLRKIARPMIEKKMTCEEILDLSQHDDDAFEHALKSRDSRSPSNESGKQGADDDSDLDEAINNLRKGGDGMGAEDVHFHMAEGSPVSGTKKKELLERMNKRYEQDQVDSINSLRVSKQLKRRQAKLDAEADRKWMIFRDLDAFDEADMVKVAKFMSSMMQVHGKLSTMPQAQLPGYGENVPDDIGASNSGKEGGGSGGDIPTIDTSAQEATAAEALRLLGGESPGGVNRKRSIHGKGVNLSASLGLDDASSGRASLGNNDATTRDSWDGTDKGTGFSSGEGIQVRRSLSTNVISKASFDPVQPMELLPLTTPPRTNIGRSSSVDMIDVPPSLLQTPMGTLLSNGTPVTPMEVPTPVVTTSSSKTGVLSLSTPKQTPLNINAHRGNSLHDIETMLLRGQVVITPTTAMGAKSPATKRGSAGSADSSPAGSGRNVLSAQSSKSPQNKQTPSSSSNKTSSGTKTGRSHADNLERELKSNFDMNNFRLPSGFVTPLVSKAVVDVYKQGGKLSKDSVHKLLRLCYRQFQTLPNTTHINMMCTDRLTVVGDIHGQLADLLYILDHSGLPSPTNRYIFNGDFVDRGPCGVEVMCILMALYLSNPGQVTLNRGNHEDFAICCAYGFQAECISKYDEPTFGMFVEVFNHLPLFALVNSAVFVLHGGLFHTADVKLAELDQIKRTEFTLRDIPVGGEDTAQIPRNRRDDFLKQLQRDALWSDPSHAKGLAPSNRGAGVQFGPDIAKAFCILNKISLVVRSHECCRTGFDIPYLSCASEAEKRTVCTIFSASNYGGGGNSAAYMVFTRLSVADGGTCDVSVEDSRNQKSPSKTASSHTTTNRTDVPDTDLQYEINYFHIDVDESAQWAAEGGNISEDDEDDDGRSVSSTSSTATLIGDLSLHQLILRKRMLLQRHFELMDPAQTGAVPKDVWAEVMHQVLSLHISWDNLFTVLVDEDCVSYPTMDRGNRLNMEASPDKQGAENADTDTDTDAEDDDKEKEKEKRKRLRGHWQGNIPGKTPFVTYAKFLQNFSLSLEAPTEISAPASIANGEDAAGGSVRSPPTRRRRSSMSGHLVDSLYAHHKELTAIFSFFDVKKDQVISKEEFRAGMHLVRKMQEQESSVDGVEKERVCNTGEEFGPEFEAECDQLLEIMNLNGSGFIDINDFFEMFRMSEAMVKRNKHVNGGQQFPSLSVSAKMPSTRGAPDATPGQILVAGVLISGD